MFFSAVLKGLTLGLLLAISVGPVIFAIIKQSISNGYKGGIAFILGVFTSDAVLILVCNMFSKLLSSAMQYQYWIGIGGSIFLMTLGVYSFFFKKSVTEHEKKIVQTEFKSRHMITTYLTGFLMNVLNPAVILFWFAVTATILNDSQSYQHADEYRFIVFATCLTFTLSTDLLKVFFANKLRNKLTPHNIHRVNQISGIIFMIFGLVLMIGTITGKTSTLHA